MLAHSVVYHDVLVFLARVELKGPRILLEEILRGQTKRLVWFHPDQLPVRAIGQIPETVHGHGALEEVCKDIVGELIAHFIALLLGPFLLDFKVALDDFFLKSLAALEHHRIFQELTADHADKVLRDLQVFEILDAIRL